MVMRTGLLLVPWMAAAFSTGSLAAQSPIGEWTLRVEWPAGPAAVKLTVSDSAGVWRVDWEGPQGQLTASEVGWAESQLKFVLTVEDQDRQPVRLRFAGRITGEQIRGELSTPNQRKIAVSGQRALKAATGGAGGRGGGCS